MDAVAFLLGSLGLLIWTAASRALPRLALGAKCGHGADTMFHLIYINAIREHGSNAFTTLPQCMPHAADSSYPFGLHWLLAQLPKRIVYQLEPVWGATVDCFLVMVALAGGVALGFSYQMTMLAGFLAATSPMYLSANPLRCFELNCRGFGELCFALGAILTILGVSGNWLAYSAGLLFFALAIISSKFATQVLLLLWLGVGIACNEPLIMISPVLSFLAAILISGGHYYRVFTSHVRFLVHYAVNMQWQHKALKNARMGIPGLLRLVRTHPSQVPHALFRFLFGNPYLSLALRGAPWIVVLAAWYAQPEILDPVISERHYRLVFAWAMLPLLIFVVVNIPGVRFLGEPQRYADYSVIPIAWLASQVLLNLSEGYVLASIILIVCLQLAFCLIAVTALLIYKSRNEDQLLWNEAIEAVDKLGTPRKVLTIPIQWGRRIVLGSQHLADGGAGATTPQSIAAAKLLFDGSYPFPSKDLNKLSDDLGYDTILVDKQTLAFEKGDGSYPFEEFCEPVFENSKFAVYRFSNA